MGSLTTQGAGATQKRCEEEEEVQCLQKWQSILKRCTAVEIGVTLILETIGDLGVKLESAVKKINSGELLIVKILTAACACDPFLQQVKSVVAQWSGTPGKLADLVKLLHNVYLFCRLSMQRIPFLGKDVLLSVICACLGVTASNPRILQANPNLLDQFAGLQKKIEEISKLIHVEKLKDKTAVDPVDMLQLMEPPENFREVSIIPTLEELITDTHAFLRPNLVDGCYRSSEHYLDVQFRLLREDLIQPLRNGVQDFIRHK